MRDFPVWLSAGGWVPAGCTTCTSTALLHSHQLDAEKPLAGICTQVPVDLRKCLAYAKPRCCAHCFMLLTASWTCHGMLQVMRNPFHTPTTRITSKVFDQKVKVLAKRLG